jgi:hypothetical protein
MPVYLPLVKWFPLFENQDSLPSHPESEAKQSKASQYL